MTRTRSRSIERSTKGIRQRFEYLNPVVSEIDDEDPAIGTDVEVRRPFELARTVPLRSKDRQLSTIVRKDLDSMVLEVGHVDPVQRVDRDARRDSKRSTAASRNARAEKSASASHRFARRRK